MHKLPITKEYIVKEYADVFQGIGTQPGGPYHIRLKQDYKLVQPPPRSVPIAMQPAYKTELERLVKEGIITEVYEHTEWINSIVPVMVVSGYVLTQKTSTKQLKETNGTPEQLLTYYQN